MAIIKTFCMAGLHARPAAVFVKAVLDSGHGVSIGRPEGALADARSIVAVLGLDILPGEAVVLQCDDVELLDRLAAMLETNL